MFAYVNGLRNYGNENQDSHSFESSSAHGLKSYRKAAKMLFTFCALFPKSEGDLHFEALLHKVNTLNNGLPAIPNVPPPHRRRHAETLPLQLEAHVQPVRVGLENFLVKFD